MVRRNRIRAALVFACATLLTTAAAAQDGQKTVLTLYPTRINAPAAVELDRTLERALRQRLGGKLDYYAEHVDRPALFGPWLPADVSAPSSGPNTSGAISI